MPIPFTCDSCGRSLNVRDELAGQQIYCPDCKSILTVPLYAPPPEEEDVPMAAVAPAAEQDALSLRAEEPPPPKPEVPQLEEWDDEEEPAPRPAVTPTAAAGPNIGAILGGVGLMVGAVVLVFVGLATGLWIIKGIVILFIAGIVTFIKGLFGKSD